MDLSLTGLPLLRLIVGATIVLLVLYLLIGGVLEICFGEMKAARGLECRRDDAMDDRAKHGLRCLEGKSTRMSNRFQCFL